MRSSGYASHVPHISIASLLRLQASTGLICAIDVMLSPQSSKMTLWTCLDTIQVLWMKLNDLWCSVGLPTIILKLQASWKQGIIKYRVTASYPQIVQEENFRRPNFSCHEQVMLLYHLLYLVISVLGSCTAARKEWWQCHFCRTSFGRFWVWK